MTRTIGLFELTWHPQNLRELCRIVDAEANDVTVFTDESTYRDWLADADVDNGAYSWVLQDEAESLESYFGRVEEHCTEAVDFLMVVTPFGSGIITSHFVEFDPDCPKVCWIYNSQACIESTHTATDARDDLEEVTPRLRHALAAEDPETAERALKPYRYYMRPYILDNYDGFVVEYPPIEEHLEERWAWSRPIFTFLPYVYEGPIPESTDHRDGIVVSPSPDLDSVEVTVSGRVVENVRDYGPVLNAFEELFATHGDEVELTILGRPVGGFGDRVMARCRDLDSDGHQVTYYPDTDWISTEEFDRVLKRSDVLLNPIYLTEETTREPAPDEVRGTTKGTGVLFDALKYGKPLVLPEGFTLAPMVEDATITYNTQAELRRTIETLVDNPAELAALTAAARRNGAAYDVERQRGRFQSLVDDVLTRR